jgi:hypothetical protein
MRLLKVRGRRQRRLQDGGMEDSLILLLLRRVQDEQVKVKEQDERNYASVERGTVRC